MVQADAFPARAEQPAPPPQTVPVSTQVSAELVQAELVVTVGQATPAHKAADELSHADTVHPIQ